MTILALDPGVKHIGLALATTNLASPLTTLGFSSSQQLIADLDPIVKKHRITHLIIGLPSGPLKPFVLQLKQILVQHFAQLKIYLFDETLTSHQAQKNLLHKKRRSRQKLSHAAAAAIILQSWLDLHPSKS